MQEYDAAIRALQAFRRSGKLFLLLLLIFSLVACHDELSAPAESHTTTGTIGPFVATSDILLSVLSFYSPTFSDGILLNLKQADTLESLRVGSGDALQVALGSVIQTIEEVRGISCSGKVGPCQYTYYYRVLFSDDPQSKIMTVSFKRENGISSHTTVTFPVRPVITEPAPDAVISLAADTLFIAWPLGEEA